MNNTPEQVKQRGESPTMPASNDEAEIPMEDAICAQFMDSSFSESDTASSKTSSPCLSAAIRKELGEGNPSNIVTKKMLEEEERLQEEGVKLEEEKRRKQNQMLLDDACETTEMRYERLKYLLSKSTLYTEYLVERMKKQKEEQERKRQRMMKRKSKLEDKPESEGEKAETRKRKADGNSPSSAKRAKRETKESEEAPISEENPISEEKSISEENPISEDKNEEMDTIGDCPRVINGEEVSPLQPKLMEGGRLRPYQVEGYTWLKPIELLTQMDAMIHFVDREPALLSIIKLRDVIDILYENGVNGILADEMGLGKTVQCVAMLAHLVQMGIPGPFLVCAPLSTIPNWLSELQRFAPKVPTILYHGGKDERALMTKKIRRRHKVEEGLYVKPVVITSYEIAMIDRRYLAHNEWKYLIVDEGHRIKNTHCRLIKELRMYDSTHRLLLTGTPLQNNLAELWSLLNFLLPEIFDDKGSFEMWFDANCMDDETEEQIVKQEQGKNILGMLHQILSPFMLRRLKSDVDLCIPPKKEVLVYAPLTKEQKNFYSALVDRTIFSFLEEKNEKPEEKVEMNAAGHPKRRSASCVVNYSIMMEDDKERKEKKGKTGSGRSRWKDLEDEEKELESWIMAVSDKPSRKSLANDKPKTSQVTIKMRNVMMQLRKCCNHPYLLEHPLDTETGDLALTEGVVKTSGKMLVLDQMLKALKKGGHKVLIFSQMTRMLDLIEDFCQIRKYEFCRLDGSTSVNDRRDSMNTFNQKDSDKFIFLLSTRAGGLGINLTGADTVIIYDSDWNPQCDLQAQDRCHRIGQTKPVVVYRFITANTIDQKIIERAANKRKLEKMIIHKGNFKSGNFISHSKPISPEELRELLQSKDHTSEMKNDHLVISKPELAALLDRSDLYRQWEESKLKNQLQDASQSESSTSATTATTTTTRKSKRTPNTKGKAKTKSSVSELFKVVDAEDWSNSCGDDSGSQASSKDGDC